MRKLILLVLVLISGFVLHTESQEKPVRLKAVKGRVAVLEFYTSQG